MNYKVLLNIEMNPKNLIGAHTKKSSITSIFFNLTFNNTLISRIVHINKASFLFERFRYLSGSHMLGFYLTLFGHMLWWTFCILSVISLFIPLLLSVGGNPVIGCNPYSTGEITHLRLVVCGDEPLNYYALSGALVCHFI